jgi:hypothetical protein
MFSEDGLACPDCGCFNLHHEKVTLYERREDAKATLVIEVANARTTVRVLPSSRTGNPSSRRHGLCIHFSCEGCPARPVLEIQQHKGTTYVEWSLSR